MKRLERLTLNVAITLTNLNGTEHLQHYRAPPLPPQFEWDFYGNAAQTACEPLLPVAPPAFSSPPAGPMFLVLGSDQLKHSVSKLFALRTNP